MNRENGEILLFPWPAAACLRDDAGAMLLSNSSSGEFSYPSMRVRYGRVEEENRHREEDVFATSEANVIALRPSVG